MPTLQVFDPALCCSSGVCGQDVDARLVQAAADIDWAKSQGARIERFNLAQQPLAFAQNEAVRGFLERSGQEALPITVLDGQVVLAGRYPTRQQLSQWAGLAAPAAPAGTEAGRCCGGGKCC
jgi:hypothetical protein